MRILMFGRGVIAAIYGQAFQAAGHDVEFYVRPGRSSGYGTELYTDITDGRLKWGNQRVRQVMNMTFRESLDPRDVFDIIVVSVGHHQLSQAAEFLAPRIGHATVLVFGNIWEEPVAAVSPLPVDQVVFGFPQAGGGFAEDGVLHGALLGSVVIGRGEEPLSARQLAVRAAFLQAGLRVREETDMRGWLFIHFIADAGMFAEGARGQALAGMIGDRRAFRRAFTIGRELLPLVRARGVDLRLHRTVLLPYRLSVVVAAAVAVATTRVAIARISLAAHTDPHPAEARAIIEDTLREAARLGIPAPLLVAAVRESWPAASPTSSDSPRELRHPKPQ